VDLDLGNYERYLDVTLSRDNNITTGKIYREVIEREVRSSTTTLDPWLMEEWSACAIEKRGLSWKDSTGPQTSITLLVYVTLAQLNSPFMSLRHA
jgi:hypothetical protein